MEYLVSKIKPMDAIIGILGFFVIIEVAKLGYHFGIWLKGIL